MSEEEKKAIENIEYFLELGINSHKKSINANKPFVECYGLYNNGNLQILLNLIEKQQKEIEKLKKKIIEANKYIKEEMYIDDNPTICGEEPDTLIELPISLNLYNEDLRKLLELLEED